MLDCMSERGGGGVFSATQLGDHDDESSPCAANNIFSIPCIVRGRKKTYGGRPEGKENSHRHVRHASNSACAEAERLGRTPNPSLVIF